jgi:hypothetical protein
MKCAVEMSSGARIGSGILKLVGGICRHADTQDGWRWHKPTLGK